MRRPRPAAPEGTPTSFALAVVEGPDAGATFTIDAAGPTRVLVGQSPACVIKLADPQVSRRHVSLAAGDGVLTLIDLGSTNGTTVNGASVREVFLHGGTQVGGWTAKQIHEAILTTFRLSDTAYGLNQLRYDLRKLKGHGLQQRDASRYVYRLTPKGVQVALLFLFFHKRLCGPLANSRFHHRPNAQHPPHSKLEAAYHRADQAIQQIVDLLAAA